MSTKNSLRHVVRRREHRERAQPAARAARFGLLEKHKDYKLRANDYHRKEDALRVLKEKAAFKNDDEFYRNMHSTQTKGGVHSLTRSNDIAPKTLALMKAQDAAYLQMQRSADQTRINKAKKNLHFLMDDDEEEQAQESKANRKADEEDDDDDDDEDDDSAGPATKKSRTGAASSAIRSRHVIFVDSVSKVENFSPAAYFQTTPELVKRKFNRLKTAQLESQSVIVNQTRGRNETAPAAAAAAASSAAAAASSAAAAAPASASRAAVAQSKAAIASAALLARSDQSLLASYSELNSRLDRKRKIESALDKLQLERLLSQKGRRKKIVGAEDKFGEVDEKRTVYKWKMERKK